MTWAKYGVEFFDECANAGLSDAAVRTHAEAIAWLYRIESDDLRIPKHLVPRFAGSLDLDVAVKELVGLQWWHDEALAYAVVHHADVIRQSIAAQRAKRARDRRAQTAWRQRHA